MREQLCSLVERLRIPVPSNRYCSALEQKRNVKRCLCHGFFMQSAVFDRDGNYRTAKDNQVGSVERSPVGSADPPVVHRLGSLAVGHLQRTRADDGQLSADCHAGGGRVAGEGRSGLL